MGHIREKEVARSCGNPVKLASLDFRYVGDTKIGGKSSDWVLLSWQQKVLFLL